MKKPRSRQPGTPHTISCTDEQWEAIKAGAVQARMRVSTWFVECSLTVDPVPQKHRRLTLDAKEQRYISRTAGELARSLNPSRDTPSQFADDLRALFEARLRTWAGQGRGDEAIALLRTVFGDECAEVIATAFVSEGPTTFAAPERAGKGKTEKKPKGDLPPQGEMF